MVAYRGILTGLTKSTDHPSGALFKGVQGSFTGAVGLLERGFSRLLYREFTAPSKGYWAGLL